MSQYKVDKFEVPVRITHVDGTATEGTVFLSPDSPCHTGRQTMREHLAEATAFLPLRNGEGKFILVGKDGIACLKAGRPPDHPEEFVRRVSVWTRLVGGTTVTGDLIVPQADASFRVSDYLNTDEPWLRFEEADTVYWVRREAILEIRV
jgi:hypothetical protein